MKSLIFTDNAATIRVEYITDLIGDTDKNFTVLDIKGLTDLATKNFGINFNQLDYSIADFETLAIARSLNLYLLNYDVHATTPEVKLVSGGIFYGTALGIGVL